MRTMLSAVVLSLMLGGVATAAPADDDQKRKSRRDRSPAVVLLLPVETPHGIVYMPITVHQPRPTPQPKPEYWGWDGKRRPDSWRPADEKPSKPSKPAPKPSGEGGR